MNIDDELKEYVELIFSNPEKIDKMKLYIKMKNGNKIHYIFNRKKLTKKLKREKI